MGPATTRAIGSEALQQGKALKDAFLKNVWQIKELEQIAAGAQGDRSRVEKLAGHRRR